MAGGLQWVRSCRWVCAAASGLAAIADIPADAIVELAAADVDVRFWDVASALGRDAEFADIGELRRRRAVHPVLCPLLIREQ